MFNAHIEACLIFPLFSFPISTGPGVLSVKELLPIDAPPPFEEVILMVTNVMIYHRTLFHRNIALAQSDCDQLLLKEATPCPDCDLCFRVYNCCSHNWANFRTTDKLTLPWGTHKSVSNLLGGYKTVVEGKFNPDSNLNKRKALISYHQLRETKAANLLHFVFFPWRFNAADILS